MIILTGWLTPVFYPLFSLKQQTDVWQRFNLPKFSDAAQHMWTSTHEANAPSEDRNASLVNLLFMPREDHDLREKTGQYETTFSLIRVSMWCVLDGHGGGSVASYASEVLLPHIAASIANALNCTVASSGEFHANGLKRNLEPSDFSKILVESASAVSRLNPFSIGYTAPERAHEHPVYYSGVLLSDNEDNGDDDESASDYGSMSDEENSVSTAYSCSSDDDHDNPSVCEDDKRTLSGRVSPINEHCILQGKDGCFCTASMAEETVDRPIQSEEHRDDYCDSRNLAGMHSLAEISAVSKAITNSFFSVDEGWINSIDSSKVQNSCVAGGSWNSGACALVTCIIQRLDCSPSSVFSCCDVEARLTVDSSSSNINEASLNYTQIVEPCGHVEQSRPRVIFSHDAMLYTAHCGDCRAILGTSAGVSMPASNADQIVESDSDYDSKETESDESDEESDDDEYGTSGYSYIDYKPRRSMCSGLMGFGSRLMSGSSSSKPTSNSQVSSSSDVSLTLTPLCSVDLTIDHSAYNPIEVRHVLRRCKNAPRAIATSSVGGINRVAGSLAVTRALGDAYLKTPHLSFSPYKQNAPYISAQPEISSRIIMTDKATGTLLDKYIVLASDGLWECVEGEDVLSWIQTYLHEKPNLVCSNASDNRFLPLKFKRSQHILSPNNAADHIINRLLREIRKAKNLPSLAALVSIPKGRGRRSKHDDITASVIDISGFVL